MSVTRRLFPGSRAVCLGVASALRAPCAVGVGVRGHPASPRRDDRVGGAGGWRSCESAWSRDSRRPTVAWLSASAPPPAPPRPRSWSCRGSPPASRAWGSARARAESWYVDGGGDAWTESPWSFTPRSPCDAASPPPLNRARGGNAGRGAGAGGSPRARRGTRASPRRGGRFARWRRSRLSRGVGGRRSFFKTVFVLHGCAFTVRVR